MRSGSRRRGLGTEASWNDANHEMSREEFREYMDRELAKGTAPTKIIMDLMMQQNVSLEYLKMAVSIHLFIDSAKLYQRHWVGFPRRSMPK